MDTTKPLPQTQVTLSYTHTFVVSTAVVALSFFVPIIALCYLLAWGVFTYSRWQRLTLVEALALSLLSILITTTVLYSFVSALQLQLPVRFALPAQAVIALGIFAWKYRKERTLQLQARLFTKWDIVAVVATVAVFTALLIPIAPSNGGQIAQFLSYGEDNASHYALNKYISHNGAYAYHENADKAGLIQSLEIYPQGFHVNAAVFGALSLPYRLDEGGIVKAHAFFICLQYSLLIFWLIKACTFKLKKTTPLIHIVATPAFIALTGFGVFMLMLSRGFQPQIFAYVFLAAIVFLIARLISEKDIHRAIGLLYVVLFLSIGIAASWWLLLPVIGLLGLYAMYAQRLWKSMVHSLKKYILLNLVLLGTILYPIAINILLSQKHNPLSEPGGVDKLSWTIFWYLAPIIVVSAIALPHTIKRYAYLYVGLVGSIVLALIIGFYHKQSVGHFEYYFYKSIYTILLFVFALFFAHGLALAQWAYEQITRPYNYIAMPLIALGATIVIILQSQMVYLRVYANNWYPNAVQRGDLDVLFAPQADQYKDILFLGGCSPARDYLRNRWSGARYLSEGTTRSALGVSPLKNTADHVNMLLPDYAKSKPLLIVSSESATCRNNMSQTIEQARHLPNVVLELQP